VISLSHGASEWCGIVLVAELAVAGFIW